MVEGMTEVVDSDHSIRPGCAAIVVDKTRSECLVSCGNGSGSCHMLPIIATGFEHQRPIFAEERVKRNSCAANDIRSPSRWYSWLAIRHIPAIPSNTGPAGYGYWAGICPCASLIEYRQSHDVRVITLIALARKLLHCDCHLRDSRE